MKAQGRKKTSFDHGNKAGPGPFMGGWNEWEQNWSNKRKRNILCLKSARRCWMRKYCVIADVRGKWCKNLLPLGRIWNSRNVFIEKCVPIWARFSFKKAALTVHGFKKLCGNILRKQVAVHGTVSEAQCLIKAWNGRNLGNLWQEILIFFVNRSNLRENVNKHLFMWWKWWKQMFPWWKL